MLEIATAYHGEFTHCFVLLIHLLHRSPACWEWVSVVSNCIATVRGHVHPLKHVVSTRQITGKPHLVAVTFPKTFRRNHGPEGIIRIDRSAKGVVANNIQLVVSETILARGSRTTCRAQGKLKMTPVVNCKLGSDCNHLAGAVGSLIPRPVSVEVSCALLDLTANAATSSIRSTRSNQVIQSSGLVAAVQETGIEGMQVASPVSADEQQQRKW